MPHIGVPELGVILALILLVFGPKQLPEIARGLGQGIKEFKHAMRDAFAGEEAPPHAAAPPRAAAPESNRGGDPMETKPGGA